MPAPVITSPTPAAAPVNPGLFAKPGENIADYESRLGAASGAGTGAGFGAPAPIPANLITGAPTAPSTASPAAAASPTDLSGYEDNVAKNLGFKDYNDALTQLTAAPTQSETDFYNSAYSAAGLDQLLSKINQRQSDLTTATGNLNDNPWLDEASRVGRVRNLTTLANGDIKNLQDQYNTGLKSVQDLVSQHVKDQSATDASNKAKLAALESQAKSLFSEYTTNQKTQNAPPKTIKAANGATYQYDPSTQTFTQILPGKSPTASPGGGKAPVPAASPTGTGSQFANFNFTAKQVGDLGAKGLQQADANGILQDIKSGQTLDNIRQQMTASGLDPGLLDTIMYYVDPAHNTPAKATTSKTSSSSSRTL